ncbi:MAG: fructose-bisphosphatase class II [Myxococcales bacterium]|nr:fructose-bisphosphatase class II [Myxococcales bacterium]|tara:strand:+ start:435 stop:1400 length:966 start_codon:yes stop_codon:yes gene_type:complete
MDRNLALELVRVTEAAALSCSRLMGRGDKNAADEAAVAAMRRAFEALQINGTVVIGEGERDEAPMLYIGEKVGGDSDGPELDIAVDPLEGTNLCAYGKPNALAVVAVAPRGNLLHAPDTYMRKIACGPAGKGVVHLDKSPQENLAALAKAKGVYVEDLTAIILERERHQGLIQSVRDVGARVRLISDGDVSAAIATCEPRSGIDIMFGIGGAPEGVLAAAALRCFGGEFQGRLNFRNDGERERALKMGIEDVEKTFACDELAKGDVMFAATGVTSGDMLDGVRYVRGGAQTHSVVMRSQTGTVRFIEAQHHFDRKPKYAFE